MRQDISIDPASREEMISEVRRLALSTGSEESEIDEMIRDVKVFVAKKKRKIAGFIALRSKKTSMLLEISGLAVKENERRRGVASLLLKHAEKFADERGTERIIVRTSNDNIPALTLYQRHGFTIRKVKLGAMTEHHGGKEILGWANIPVRDEIVLEKKVSS